MDCEVKLKCEDENVENCTAKKMRCNNAFNPEVQIEHNNQSARFTCTDNTNCDEVSPTTCAPETTTTMTMTTVTTSVLYCETTHTTHNYETTSML